MWKEKPVNKMILKYILVGLSIIVSLSMNYNQSLKTLIALNIANIMLGCASIVILPKASDVYTIGRIVCIICMPLIFASLCLETPGTKWVFIVLKFFITCFSVFHIIGIGYDKLQQLRDWFHRK